MRIFTKVIAVLIFTLNLAFADEYEEGHAIAKDGTRIYYRVYGNPDGPNVLMGPHFYASLRMTQLEDQGLKDPTDEWINGLKDRYRLILVDYPRGMGQTPNPIGLDMTPDRLVQEYELVADAAGAEKFAWIGYSFGAAVGVQMATRSDRLTALMVGGFPPLNAPFERMTWVVKDMAKNLPEMAGVEISRKFANQSVGFYEPLTDWPEREKVAKIHIPRMVFMGSNDTGQGLPEQYKTELAEPIRQVETELRDMGWEIHWILGAGHLDAIKPERALSIVRRFLDRTFD